MVTKYLCHIWNTLFGFYQEPFSELWDGLLNDIMDKGQVEKVNEYTVTFSYRGNLYTIWCGNKWYSYGHLYVYNGIYTRKQNQFRPRFRTMLKLENIHENTLEMQRAMERSALYGGI